VAASTLYIDRLIDAVLAEFLSGLPAVLLVGPRGCGKTTTARRLARSVVRLDRPQEAAAVRADPDAVLASLDPPVLIDEWQIVPEVLGAVKRAVDDGSGAGRFLLTGSARSDALSAGWPGTGRVVRLTQWGLTQREIVGQTSLPSLFDELFAGRVDEWRTPSEVALRGYVDAALTGGFPEAVLLSSPRLRRAWLDGYVDQVLTRDAALLGAERDPRRLRRYLEALAANTAGVVGHKTVYDAAGINHGTARAYDGLLDLLMVTEQIPAFTTNRLDRLIRQPKRYLTDPSLLVPLLHIDSRAVLRDGDLLGRLIDTFVVAQLRAEAVVAETPTALNHLRTQNGRHEIDLVAQSPDGRIIAIEIKAAANVNAADARHLSWLRERHPDAFTCGVVFHTGPYTFALGDQIWALPISTIWSR
jgi:predicted AAA+ superfamily ATPase